MVSFMFPARLIADRTKTRPPLHYRESEALLRPADGTALYHGSASSIALAISVRPTRWLGRRPTRLTLRNGGRLLVEFFRPLLKLVPSRISSGRSHHYPDLLRQVFEKSGLHLLDPVPMESSTCCADHPIR
jgi:hypothetical protein